MSNQRLLGILVLLAGFFVFGYFGYNYIMYSGEASKTSYWSMRRAYASSAEKNAVYAGLGGALLVVGGILFVTGRKKRRQAEELAEKRLCEKCRAVCHVNDRFCSECGAPLHPSAAATRDGP